MGDVINLKHPIEANGEELKTITLPDRLKAKHLRVTDNAKGDVGKMLALIGEIAQIPPSAVDELDVEDIMAIAEKLGLSLGEFPGTGATS